MNRLLYLVRHAEVLLRGDVPMTAWQLSPTGEQQARDLSRSPVWSELTLIASSPESKAIATGQPIAEAAALDLRIEPDLHEVDRGVTPLVSRSEYDGLVAAHFAASEESVGGWEPAVEARRRTVECIERLASSASGSLCVVSHGLVLSHFLAHLRDLPSPDLDEWRAIPLPAIAVVDAESWTQVEPFVSLMEFMGLA
jgi:2,3-bisphosphoglycerate-dependent phosphoglycerate mutase